jgi:hypothetical protein
MPALACAIQTSTIRHATIFKKEDGFFSFGMDTDAIAVHRVRPDDLLTHFGIPVHKQNKDFDIGHRSNWDLVNFDGDEKPILKCQPSVIRKKTVSIRPILRPALRIGGISIYKPQPMKCDKI